MGSNPIPSMLFVGLYIIYSMKQGSRNKVSSNGHNFKG